MALADRTLLEAFWHWISGGSRCRCRCGGDGGLFVSPRPKAGDPCKPFGIGCVRLRRIQKESATKRDSPHIGDQRCRTGRNPCEPFYNRFSQDPSQRSGRKGRCRIRIVRYQVCSLALPFPIFVGNPRVQHGLRFGGPCRGPGKRGHCPDGSLHPLRSFFVFSIRPRQGDQAHFGLGPAGLQRPPRS